MVDAMDSKPIILRCEGSSPSRGTLNAICNTMDITKSKNLAYIVGIALGDGNLSNPNGRAIRLRITCDTRYPHIIAEITTKLEALFPQNKVSTIQSKTGSYLNISVYSNKLAQLIPWQVGAGSKQRSGRLHQRS